MLSRSVRVIGVITLLLLVLSCTKDGDNSLGHKFNTAPETIQKVVFQPSEKITISSGMMVFESEEAFQRSLDEFWRTPIHALVKWQEDIGFYSQSRHFYEVMIAEDKIDEQYEALPKHEQDKLSPEDRPTSPELVQALKEGHLKMVDDPEGEYWDYGLWKVQYAPVANDDGFFKVANKIYMVDRESYRIIHDGDFNKVDKLKAFREQVIDDEFLVIFKKEDKARALNYSYGIPRAWFYVPSNTNRRIMIWIDGHSEPYGSPLFSDCATAIDVTFLMRCEAQKKSWGKWKYSSSYSPSFHV